MIKSAILLLLIAFNSTAFCQFQSFLSRLKTTPQGITFAEVALIHRSRTHHEHITELGSSLLMIPYKINGKQLEIATNRFRATAGYSFKMEGQTYVQTDLYYDNKTPDPQDDFFIASLPFPVDEELVKKELQHYEDREIVDLDFREAPSEKPAYETEKVEIIKID